MAVEEEFDVVIKITTEKFRLRPKHSVDNRPVEPPQRRPLATIWSATQVASLNEIGQKIYNVIARHKGIKAVTISEKLKIPRREINHYLYGDMKKYVYQDSNFKWYIK